MQFLSKALIISLHDISIKRFGGLNGIRDNKLLESALGHPKLLYMIGIEKDVHMLAAYYCYHLIKNHPFIDGNKRIGTLAMLIFLKMNGYSSNISEKDLYDLAINIANSKVMIEDIAKKLQSSLNNFS